MFFFYAGFLIGSFISINAQDVETMLAEKNLQGYPSELLFNTISTKANEARKLDKPEISALLESKEMQQALTKSALEYSAKPMEGGPTFHQILPLKLFWKGRSRLLGQILNQSGQARYLMSDPGLCEYSWISWLPWMDCNTPEVKDTQTKLPLIMESSYSCYSP